MSDAAAGIGVPETHRDLLVAPLTGVLTTLGPDGDPQSTAVWFIVEGNELKVSVPTDRQKYRNLRAHAKATLFVMDTRRPSYTLEIRAEVEIRPDPDKDLFPRLAAKYRYDLSAWDPDGPPRVTLVLRPNRIVTHGR